MKIFSQVRIRGTEVWISGRSSTVEQMGHASHCQISTSERSPTFDQPHAKLGPRLRPQTRQRLGVPLRPAPHVAPRRRRSQRRGPRWICPANGLSRLVTASRYSSPLHAHHESMLPQLRTNPLQVRRQPQLHFEE